MLQTLIQQYPSRTHDGQSTVVIVSCHLYLLHMRLKLSTFWCMCPDLVKPVWTVWMYDLPLTCPDLVGLFGYVAGSHGI